MPRRILPVSVLAAAAILAGCGGGDEGPPALADDVFITKADQICSQGAIDLQKRVTVTFGNQAPTEDEGTTFTTVETVPLLTAQLEALRALTPPEGDQETVGAIWDAMEDGVKTLQDDPETALDGSRPMADADELARGYGFRSCGAENPALAAGATGDTGAEPESTGESESAAP
ncbi:MAG: hypothetical protein M3Y23_05815 [Actinomycetota bacterium]|nr:hypothetical protein [Actinomycetota bacterium]